MYTYICIDLRFRTSALLLYRAQRKAKEWESVILHAAHVTPYPAYLDTSTPSFFLLRGGVATQALLYDRPTPSPRMRCGRLVASIHRRLPPRAP